MKFWFRKNREHMKAFPIYYGIELVRGCICDCIMCVAGEQDLRFASYHSVCNILDKIKPHVKRLTFAGTGEPLLHTHIGQIISRCIDIDMTVTLNTNGILMRKNLSRILMKLKELELKVSVDAATAQTYRKIRGIDAFDTVFENVRHFSALRNVSNRNNTLIFVYVVMRENIHEVFDFVDRIVPLSPDRVEFHPVRLMGNLRYKKRRDEEFVWDFEKQQCESFRETYNEKMIRVQDMCTSKGIACEITII